MKRENRDKWVAALRSGDYLQGQGQLKPLFDSNENEYSTPHYCCLGVYCDAVGIDLGEGPGEWDSSGYGVPIEEDESGDTCIGVVTDLEPLLDDIGLSRNTMNLLMEMNDDANKSFTEIAAWIEEHL